MNTRPCPSIFQASPARAARARRRLEERLERMRAANDIIANCKPLARAAPALLQLGFSRGDVAAIIATAESGSSAYTEQELGELATAATRLAAQLKGQDVDDRITLWL